MWCWPHLGLLSRRNGAAERPAIEERKRKTLLLLKKKLMEEVINACGEKLKRYKIYVEKPPTPVLKFPSSAASLPACAKFLYVVLTSPF